MNDLIAKMNITQVKALNDKDMTFTCYGNVKNIVDYDDDVTVDGAFEASIEYHNTMNTKPRFLWNHNKDVPPIGAWLEVREDGTGLLLKGQFANTDRGREIYELLKIDPTCIEFSIGFVTLKEKYDPNMGNARILEQVHVKEISACVWGANPESKLVSIKAKLSKSELPTKRELEIVLKSAGLSNRQAEMVANKYNPDHGKLDIFDEIALLYEK